MSRFSASIPSWARWRQSPPPVSSRFGERDSSASPRPAESARGCSSGCSAWHSSGWRSFHSASRRSGGSEGTTSPTWTTPAGSSTTFSVPAASSCSSCLALLIVMALAGLWRRAWWVAAVRLSSAVTLLFAFVQPYLLPDLHPLRDPALAAEARQLAADGVCPASRSASRTPTTWAAPRTPRRRDSTAQGA